MNATTRGDHITTSLLDAPAPTAVKSYLEARSCTLSELMQLGVELITPAEAARRGGFRDRSFSRWKHALWFPTMLAKGDKHPARGEIVLLRGGEFGIEIERDRLSVSSKVAPNLVTFFPHDWATVKRIVVCESWLKGFIAYRASEGKYGVIALAGIDGLSADHQLVDNLRPPTWGATRPDVIFCYDTPTRGNPKSAKGIRDSIRRAMHLLADYAGAFYEARIPLPRDRDKLGLDDYRKETSSDASVRMLIDGAERIGGSVDATQYIQRLPETFAADAPPEPRDIVPGLLPCRSGVLFAPGFERKSTIAMLLAAHVALGRSIFGRPIARPGAVLYVTAEDEAEDVHRTIKHMIDAGSLTLSPEESVQLRAAFQILDATRLPGLFTLNRKLADGGWQPGELFSTVEAAIQAVGNVSLVVFDTLSSLGLSETEGMNEAAAAYHRGANTLARTHDCSVLAIHHVGKEFAQNRTVDMYGARGGSAIIDNARFALQLQREMGTANELKEYPTPTDITTPERQGVVASTRILRLHVHKIRWNGYDTDPRRPLWVKAIGWAYSTYDALREGATQAHTMQMVRSQQDAQRAETQEMELRVIEAIRKSGAERVPVTGRQLDALTVFLPGRSKPIGKDNVRAAAERAESRGLLKKVKREGKGGGFYWEPTDDAIKKY